MLKKLKFVRRSHPTTKLNNRENLLQQEIEAFDQEICNNGTHLSYDQSENSKKTFLSKSRKWKLS